MQRTLFYQVMGMPLVPPLNLTCSPTRLQFPLGGGTRRGTHLRGRPVMGFPLLLRCTWEHVFPRQVNLSGCIQIICKAAGVCYTEYVLQVFNGCPLRIHCTASWIHPDTRDQHILIGAEEGIYNLNLNELHETAIDQLYPRRTTWMYVIKDVLMSLSG